MKCKVSHILGKSDFSVIGLTHFETIYSREGKPPASKEPNKQQSTIKQPLTILTEIY